MTDREKLIEILSVPIYPHELADPIEVVADYLLDNGVTFATDTNVGNKWISVEDRLPGTQKVLITDGDIVMRGYRRPDGVWKYGAEEHMKWERLSIRPVTHWMPLPEPPRVQGVQNGTDHA